MNNLNSKWDKFVETGAVNDYISYKNSLSQNAEQRQGDTQNAYKDGRTYNQRTEYR